MKRIWLVPFLFSGMVLFLTVSFTEKTQKNLLTGAWQQNNGHEQTVIIVTDNIFASATYNLIEKKFISSFGGKCNLSGNTLTLITEWNSLDSGKIGRSIVLNIKTTNQYLTIEGLNGSWERIDDGTPGALTGAWIITGSFNNDQVTKRKNPFYPRRTMKVLSGKHFQWIAYNVVTKQFIDTGGGTYTTEDGKYTETIHFFTKTAASIGKTLSFEYHFVNGDWRHKGQKSTGGVLDECWSKRETLENQIPN